MNNTKRSLARKEPTLNLSDLDSDHDMTSSDEPIPISKKPKSKGSQPKRVIDAKKPVNSSNSALSQSPKKVKGLTDDDVSSVFVNSYLAGLGLTALVYLAVIFQTILGKSYGDGVVAHVLTSIFDPTIKLLFRMSPGEEVSAIRRLVVMTITLPFLFLPVTVPFFLSKRAASRKCESCGAKWSVFFTGESDFSQKKERITNTRRTESRVSNGQSYKKDLSLRQTWSDYYYHDTYNCSDCDDTTTRLRVDRILVTEEVTADSGWYRV